MIAFLLAFVLGAGQEPPLRVGVLSLLVPTRVEVVCRDASIELPGSKTLAPGVVATVSLAGAGIVATTSDGWRWTGRAVALGRPGTRLDVVVIGRETRSRSLDGPLAISAGSGRLDLVATLGLESVVATAVAAEVEGAEDDEALDAVSIVIRSYLAASRGRHGASGFDVCDTTHCVHSRGSRVPDTSAGRAAERATVRTAGLVLEHRGRLVAGFCSAVCGGSTATPADAWGGSASAYERVACRNCSASPYASWHRRLDASDVGHVLETLLGRRLGPGAYVDFVRTSGGFVRSIAVHDGGRTYTVAGESFRLELGRRLGWDAVPGARYAASRVPGGYALEGSGHGHGVGLCILGAVEMARRGASRDAILAHYFPRCRVASGARSRW